MRRTLPNAANLYGHMILCNFNEIALQQSELNKNRISKTLTDEVVRTTLALKHAKTVK